jgi:murein DD-endopeptidase MepM/ murein hydrolase activator NlpD
VCILDGTFLLGRPIGAGGRNTIDTSSRYGTIRKRVRDVYFGVQFLNSTGTPVLAAADGDVIVAGDDSQTLYGPRLNMYGKLVILKHSLPGISGPVYTLYAHLSELSVKAEGDVKAGEQIGLVGSTGSSSGSTLYFEVRIGENAYDAARNPEMWLQLLPDDEGNLTGTLAGRVVDPEDKYVALSNILVEQVRRTNGAKIRPIYLKTYLDRHQRGNTPWNESFAASNLPEGTYQVSFWFHSKLYQREVEVQPGKVTFLTFSVK